MKDFNDSCNNTILETEKLLKQNSEWELRYDEYAKKISSNINDVIQKKSLFHQWKPLFLYMNVTEAKGGKTFSLRYLGQDVAHLKVKKNIPVISTKKFDKNNLKYFGCSINLNNCEWRSEKAQEFRKFFNALPKRNNIKKNDEHRIESLLLTEFSKSSSKNKVLLNIQPVRLALSNRFQMPTPISASKTTLTYSNSSRGGIDILARIGTGNGIKLSVIEVKDENKASEPPAKAIQQGLAYATFIQQLLRSKSGEMWWKLFGFNRKLPGKIQINVVCAMPSSNNNDTSFAGENIPFEKDCYQLHYIYFQENNNKIENIVTSLK
jgi:hypothetical protein